MKLIPELLGHYNAIDRLLESQRQSSLGDAGPLRQIERRQMFNDQAHFVLFWGQLETRLDDGCRDAIRKRRSNPDWTKRRGWDLYDPDQRRLSGLSFEERVSLVLDKQQGSGSAWKMVMDWYNIRNLIAHGGTYARRIDLNDVVGDFYTIESKIAP
jgi:hypothetical protein